jgi:SAM-dependent methyltransferase
MQAAGEPEYGPEHPAPEPALLNLGSGEDYREGYWNADINPRYEPDQIVDLAGPWPDEWENHFHHVLASHIFEHLPDLDHVFQEAARVLRDGGWLEVRVPVGINARTDWTHQHEFTYDTPLQFAQNWQQKTDDYQFDPTVPFRLVNRELDMVMHGPLKPFSPLLQRMATTMPGVWTSGWPCSSGELTAVYRRLER